jgi:hypothetical protein
MSIDFLPLILLFIQSINELPYLLWIHKYFYFIIKTAFNWTKNKSVDQLPPKLWINFDE